MSDVVLKIKKLHQEAIIPEYQSKGAAGFDFYNECLEHKATRQESHWMKLDDAAAFAGVSTFTIRRWATAGKIEFRKLNRARCGRILIRRESLYRFIESLEGNTQIQQEACNE